MAVTLSPLAGAGTQFFNNNGVPLSGGLLYTYAAGTSTPLATYTTSSGSVANSNPIVLDSAGRPPNEVWLTNAANYKFVLQDSSFNQIATWDNITGSVTYDALTSATGSSLVGYSTGPTVATPTTVQDKLRNLDSFISYPSTNIYGPGRDWFSVQVPTYSSFIDNVFSVQNKSTDGTIYGNAAINFLDLAGTERGAIGYSRNNAIQPAGYYPNTLYCEIGNAFTTDAQVTNFAVINTIKAGGPYWGGAAQSYFPILVESGSGKITLNDGGNNGSIRALCNIFDLGAIGGITSQLDIAGLNTAVRFREYEYTDSFAMTTNVSNMIQGTPVGQDDVAMSSWKMQMGYGNGSTPVYDSFKVGRVAPGGTTWTTLFYVDKDGNACPGTDNTQSSGGSANRWSVIYAGTGTINTSDEREKQDVKDLSESEKQVAVAIKGLIKSFRFKDAVLKKGDKARIHFGVMAQQIAEAFKIVGLNPDDYGMFCYDEWPATEAIMDKDNKVIYPAQSAGNRYGVRYDELLAFVISVI